MLSMTNADTPKVGFATPDDVRLASERALNIWLGAFSPLWAPFVAATATGLGFWSMSQAMKRSLGFAGMEGLTPDTHLFARWPGFALPFATPWSKGWGDVAQDADRIAELTHDSLSAPIQIAFEAEEKLEEAIEEAIATAHESLDLLAPMTDDLFPVVEAANAVPAQVITPAAEAVVEAKKKIGAAATEAAKTTVKAEKKAADTAAEVTETAVETAKIEAAKTAGAAARSTKSIIDPVSETPVVPAVAEATAEKLPLPPADVSPAPAPRKPRKPKA